MVNVALFGFGTIGSGVAEILVNNRKMIEEKTGIDFNLKYILDLRDFPGHPLESRIVHDVNVILDDPDVGIVVEMMGGVHPAYDFTLAAIRAGKSAVTSNKAVIAECGPELLDEARANGVSYLFEASVGGCIPIIRPLQQQTEADEVTEIFGIMNGTTNYILTEMKNGGTSFEDALSQARALGYAEADPTADVGGFDTCRKICILAAVAFGELPDYRNVRTVGIEKITPDMISDAEKRGCSLKLIGRAVRKENGVEVSAEPMLVMRDSVLAGIDGVNNAIEIKGKASGELVFCGRGAGKLPTADAVVTDIIEIAKNKPAPMSWKRTEALMPAGGDFPVIG